MTGAKSCDRCGQLYLPYEHKATEKANTQDLNTVRGFNGIMLVLLDTKGRYYSGRPKDLCSNCLEKFLEFMEGA